MDADSSLRIVEVQGFPTPFPVDPKNSVTLGIGELSTMLLGGVLASTLLAAGRIDTDEATAGWLDLAFAPVAAPMMMFEY